MRWYGVLASIALLAAMLSAGDSAADPIVMCNVAIPMSDGVSLRGNVTRPGPGEYPTVLTVTGYNKDLGRPTGNCAAGDGALVGAGYNVVVVDDRGTGSSGGRWDIWGERTLQDYPELLDWIVAQEWSVDDAIATTGGSYLGITSLLVAATGHPAVNAVWADVPMADAYRDVTYFGGNLDTTFMPFWFGFTQGTNANPPTQAFQGESPERVAVAAYDHFAAGPAYVGAQLVAGSILGSREGVFTPYDDATRRARSPGELAHKIKAAVFYTGGWFDIFQRGEPYLWNAFTSTPANGKKWVQSPTYHTGGNDHWSEMGIGSKTDVKVKWFDHWLKGIDNDIETIPPIHQWVVGAEKWETPAAWPAPGTQWTKFYLSPDDTGSATAWADGSLLGTSALTTVQELMPFTPAGGLCNRSTTQWAAGVGSGQPCETNQRPSEVPTIVYSTDVLASDLHIAGPITLNLWAEIDRTDASFYAALTDVAPDGTSTQVSAGALNASHRAIDPSRTWYNADGDVILPWHPFTLAALQDASLYTPTEYLIEIYPTNWTFKEGHRLRLVIGTADTPHYTVPQDRLQKMLGGTIRVLTGGRYASRLLLPVQPS